MTGCASKNKLKSVLQSINLIRPYIDLDFRDTGITKFESRIIVKQILKRNKGLRIPQKIDSFKLSRNLLLSLGHMRLLIQSNSIETSNKRVFFVLDLNDKHREKCRKNPQILMPESFS